MTDQIISALWAALRESESFMTTAQERERLLHDVDRIRRERGENQEYAALLSHVELGIKRDIQDPPRPGKCCVPPF